MSPNEEEEAISLRSLIEIIYKNIPGTIESLGLQQGFTKSIRVLDKIYERYPDFFNLPLSRVIMELIPQRSEETDFVLKNLFPFLALQYIMIPKEVPIEDLPLGAEKLVIKGKSPELIRAENTFFNIAGLFLTAYAIGWSEAKESK